MIEVKVLGTDCPKCEQLMKRTKLAITELDIECSVEKVSDIQQIIGFGVMRTPALVVDGQVKMYGQLSSVDELKKMIV